MKWTEDLAVGVSQIDEQHKELFERIDNLVQAIKSSTCRDTIPGTLDFLEEYVNEHFGDEEALMKRHGYPGFAAHKEQHEKFKQDFRQMREDFGSEASNYNRSAMTNQIVVDWILDHIKRRDVELARYLKGKGL